MLDLRFFVANGRDFGLQEARRFHFAQRAKIGRGRYDGDVGVQRGGERVGGRAHDVVCGGRTVVDVVLGVEHPLCLGHGYGELEPVSGRGTLDSGWRDSVV